MNWAKGCIVYPIALIAIWKIGGCIVGGIMDGAQEVIAERHAKQQIADEKARKRIEAEDAVKAADEARRMEAQRVAAVREAEQRRLENERREAEARARALAEREAAKFGKLQIFAMQEAPSIWRAYQQLEAAIATQDDRIRDLSAALREFGKDPALDADYNAICAMRAEMNQSLCAIRKKLEEAYLASCRYKATPSHKEYSELMRKALEEGTRAAESATRKFNQMRVDK